MIAKFKMRMKYNFFIFCIVFPIAGCTSKNKTSGLKLETVSDSLYHPDDNYTNDIAAWKKYYSVCTNTDLFSNAYYFRLEDKVHIGSINNEHEIDVNKGILLLDTSKMSNIFNLLYVKNASNCSDTLHLTNTIRTAFLNEIKTVLNDSIKQKILFNLIDTSTIKIRIGALYTNELIPGRLTNLLDTTNDEGLIKYKTLLLNPDNVLLSQTVEMFGFSAEFNLKMKPSAMQVTQLSKNTSVNLNSSADKTSITFLQDNNLQIRTTKRYTILGSFVQLKKE